MTSMQELKSFQNPVAGGADYDVVSRGGKWGEGAEPSEGSSFFIRPSAGLDDGR